MSTTIIERHKEFFNRKGAIGLIVRIDPEGGSTRTDLKRQMLVSRKTVRDLVDDAQKREYELITDGGVSTDSARKKIIELAEYGQFYRALFETTGLADAYRTLYNAQEEFDESEKEFKDFMTTAISDVKQYYANGNWDEDQYEMEQSDIEFQSHPPEGFEFGTIRYLYDRSIKELSDDS